LPQPPKCWNYSTTPPCLSSNFLILQSSKQSLCTWQYVQLMFCWTLNTPGFLLQLKLIPVGVLPLPKIRMLCKPCLTICLVCVGRHDLSFCVFRAIGSHKCILTCKNVVREWVFQFILEGKGISSIMDDHSLYPHLWWWQKYS
jgi:hypothetical protein